jgi:hypothetical protein
MDRYTDGLVFFFQFAYRTGGSARPLAGGTTVFRTVMNEADGAMLCCTLAIGMWDVGGVVQRPVGSN